MESKMKDKKNLIINGERIHLRILKEQDASYEYVSWLNDNEVNKHLETKKADIDSLKKYIHNKLESEKCLFFGIFYNENNKHIGNIKLEPISPENKIATMGMLIGDKAYWGKDIATEALNLLVLWSFNNLDIEEIDLGVLKDNAAAIRVYYKSGFSIKGENEKGFIMSVKK